GLSDITLTGDFEGTPEAVPVYTLNVKSGMEGAGKIAVNPSGNEFDAGTEITLSVTENFGYHFTSWTDAQGNVVSDKNPYTFEISANTDLTANFDKNNVYALNYVAIDDMGNKYGNQNLVTFLPAGNIVDGVHYYEEGTDVKLTVANNKILSFTGWEDGTTNAERIINMDGEKNVTVNYAVADYIVAWDLYQDQPNSQRAADYRSNSENAGLLSLRNAAGSTTSWLTRGVNNGAEEGRWGARIWKLRSEGWYWEISFSTKGYSNIKFSNGFGHNYNTYSVIKAEYSVDGTNFTEVGTYDIPERGWVDGEFTLPADANNQERVYIRWMPGSEELVGAETDYDGLSIGDIFVLADSEQANDQTAPVLVSSNPANGATGASATGSIVLTFDERVKVGTGNATLNGEEIAPTVTGKTAVFQYAGLDYNKEYSFTLPAGVITDRSGNAYAGTTINFTTMERTQPAARIYDAVVAADGTGDYKTVQEAIDAAPAGRAFPWLIFIKNGEYKGHVDVPSNKPYLHFIGQERDKVIITDDKLCGGDNALHVSVGATVVVNSDNCYFDNLTLENSWGHDKQAGPQALALNTTGDRTVFKNVAMLSYQDTWITPSTSNYRVYAKDCFIEGAVDFIYNSGNIYIDNTTLYINRKSGGYIVAPSHAVDVKWGYVF
ncbi:MAG: Ig-like domain-containing protein, partial [Prevotella sp.]|nr:Ig-like domain-containing protein [Prevotella sp.]